LTLKEGNNLETSSGKKMIRAFVSVALMGFLFIDHAISYVAVLASVILLFPILLIGLNKLLKPVFKMIFHYPGAMAAKRSSQHLNRNANTAAIMATGISIIILLGAVVKSAPEGIAQEIKSTYGGDMRITSEAPWTEEDIDKISS